MREERKRAIDALLGVLAGWAVMTALQRRTQTSQAVMSEDPKLLLDQKRFALEREKFRIETQKVEFEYLKQLYDYTKFHIGLYTGVVTVLVTLAKSDFISSSMKVQSLIWLGIVFIGLAGLAGGVVASTLASYVEGTEGLPKTLKTFLGREQGPSSGFK